MINQAIIERFNDGEAKSMSRVEREHMPSRFVIPSVHSRPQIARFRHKITILTFQFRWRDILIPS